MDMQEYNCFKKPFDKCSFAKKIAESIAAQENAIACILQAECDKLKKIICNCSDFNELLLANHSVDSVVKSLAEIERALRDKLAAIIPILKDCKDDKDGRDKKYDNDDNDDRYDKYY